MKEKFINSRYVFYPFLAFFFGITMARKLFAGNLEVILLVVGLFAIVSTFLIFKKFYKILAILFAFFALGNGMYFLGVTTFDVKDYSSPVAVVGRVSDDMQEKTYSIEIVLDDVKIDGKKSDNVRLTIKSPKSAINVGDFVAFEASLEKSKPFTLDSFNSSDLRDGVRYHAEVSYNNIVFSDGYTKFDEKVRLAVKDQLYLHMSEKNAGISYAVLFGDKNGVDDSIEIAYTQSGVIHILSVSGLHVSFLVSLLYFLLKLCRANKYLRFAITTIFIIFYAFLCGFTPSVLRAGIMSIVYMLSKLLMRKYDSLNSLGLAGFAICLFSPLTALDLGFQLSFFCVLGILILAPSLTRLFAKFIPYKIASLLALSISAQIGILPIMASFGAGVNILSIFANLIILPVFSVIFPLLFLVAMLSTFLPFIGYLLKLVDYLLVAINAIAIFFSSSGLSFSLSPFKTSIASMYFITLMAIGKYVMRKSLFKFAVFSVMVFVITLTLGIFLIPAQTGNSVVIVGNNYSSSVILENDSGERLIVGESYLLSRYQTAYDIKSIDYFVAIDLLSNESFENLAVGGVENFISDSKNSHNKVVNILEGNKDYSFGDFDVKFVQVDGKSIGVAVTFGQYKIFVASEDKIDYNSSVMKEISPNIVFSEGEKGNNDFLLVSKNFYSYADYSISRDGNMKFEFDGVNWSKRGID